MFRTFWGHFPKSTHLGNQMGFLVGDFNPFETYYKVKLDQKSFPQIGVKIENIWNHHPVFCCFFHRNMFVYNFFKQKKTMNEKRYEKKSSNSAASSDVRFSIILSLPDTGPIAMPQFSQFFPGFLLRANPKSWWASTTKKGQLLKRTETGNKATCHVKKPSLQITLT